MVLFPYFNTGYTMLVLNSRFEETPVILICRCILRAHAAERESSLYVNYTLYPPLLPSHYFLTSFSTQAFNFKQGVSRWGMGVDPHINVRKQKTFG